MNRITREKRNQLTLVAAGTLLVMAGLYFGLIRMQQSSLQKTLDEQQTKERELRQIEDAKKSSAQIETQLAEINKRLEAQEADMATGDLYTWMFDFVRTFTASYGIEIRQFTSKGESEMTLLPNYPYRQTTVTITGNGFYHEIGRFIADFENQHASSRVMNIELAPDGSQDAGEKEKLTFRMDIVSLVRSSSQPARKLP